MRYTIEGKPATFSTPRSHSTSTTLYSQNASFDQKIKDFCVELQGEDKVAWGAENPDHPLNWSVPAKVQTTAIIYWLEFFMTAISSSGAAAAESASEEYGISKTVGYFVFVTLYLLGQTICGVFCSPISEVFGRRTIYAIGTALFAAASIVVAAPPSLVAVCIGRFFQGVAAAIPATVAFGNFNDMFDAHTRIWIVYWYTVSGMSGLALGPVYSAYVTQHIGWRWVFYISTIAAGLSLIACIFMKESSADQILQSKVESIRKETGRDSLRAVNADDSAFSLGDFFKNALLRPLHLLVTEPLVFFCAALCGIAFGLIYGLTEGLNIVYTAMPFDFSDTEASLSFIAILIGLFLDFLPRIYDDYLLKKKRRTQQRILPETKITSFAIACPALALGLWLFGWTIPPRVTTVPWPVSMIGLVGVGFAANDFSYVLFGYVADAYEEHAASAAGAISLTRGLMAAVFPLFTSQMFNGLGNNIAVTILAAVATAFCFTPWLFLRYGAKLRKRSSMASNDEDCLVDENKYLEDEELTNLPSAAG